MKICKNCKISTPDTEFYIRTWKRKDGSTGFGVRKICKKCDIARNTKNKAGPARAGYLAYQAQYRRDHATERRMKKLERLAWLDSIKNKPCEDCGGSFPPECMDFDHLNPQTKRFTISTRAICGDGFNEKKKMDILKEISRCRLICANCHRIRTAAQFGRGLLNKEAHMIPPRRAKPMR